MPPYQRRRGCIRCLLWDPSIQWLYFPLNGSTDLHSWYWKSFSPCDAKLPAQPDLLLWTLETRKRNISVCPYSTCRCFETRVGEQNDSWEFCDRRLSWATRWAVFREGVSKFENWNGLNAPWINAQCFMVTEGEMPEGFAHECVFQDGPDTCLWLCCLEEESGVDFPHGLSVLRGIAQGKPRAGCTISGWIRTLVFKIVNILTVTDSVFVYPNPPPQIHIETSSPRWWC